MKHNPWTHPVLRGGLAGIAGGVAWAVGIVLFFGPAQIILGDPQLQSAKMIAAFTDEPRPRVEDAPWLLGMGLLVIGVIWGWVYTWLAGSWSGSWWRRGCRFAAVGWLLMVPWFEFYLPWNVLHEPWPLVLLEMVCWTGVLACVGLAVAGVESVLRPRT